MPYYILGARPPLIKPDPGSGTWCSEPQTAGLLAFKRALQMAMDTHGIDITIGADAVKHMRHYMNNTGNDYLLDLPALLNKSAQLKRQFGEELAQAQAFAETLGPGTHELTSQRPAHGYFRSQDDSNLYFAIGGYAYWGQGTLNVSRQDTQTAYHLAFDFHFYDRYNWDAGKSVSIAGLKITDAFMQQFHKQCYAREFDVKGLLKKQLRWQKQSAAPATQTPTLRAPFAVLQP